MEHKFDYYFVRNSFKGGTVPRLVVDDQVDPMETAFLVFYKTVPETYITHLAFGSPIPPKPSLDVDGLSLEGNCSVFSKKIYDAVNPQNFKGMQFVPAIIRGKKDEEFDNFFVANVYQRIASFDPEKPSLMKLMKIMDAGST